MRKLLPLLFLFAVNDARAQLTDTVTVPEVVITSYFSDRPLLRSTSAVGVIDAKQLSLQHNQSLVPAMNTVPGVRMEERSPGSFRLSIRGSLLRSPFGIRNVKVYMDEFPLTDASGNTYLNLIDQSCVNRIEILKGPDGSLFGANSGGVVRLGMMSRGTPLLSGEFSTGSFGLFRENISFQLQKGKHIFSLRQAWQRSDGYRENSSFDRKYFQLTEQWNYLEGFQLRALVFYSDLQYRTPGGLTQAQFDANPRMARPATLAFPGATEQKAGVRNRTLYTGISHASKITSYLRHVVAVFGSFTAFENPFITNYETRDEHSDGIRTWFEGGNATDAAVHWTSQLGAEAQQTFSEISNYGNNLGAKDSLQRSDRLRAIQYFVFGRFAADIQSRWIFEAAVSLNYNGYEYESIFPVAVVPQRRNFAPQVMPRVGLSYLSADSFAFRIAVSRGYSPPTLAEIRSSDNVINTGLQPESGWNYEAGMRLGDSKQRWWMDIAVFWYRLRETIVRRVNSAGAEYFINSGSTDQPGLEFQAFAQPMRTRAKGFVRNIELRTSYAYSPFRFAQYETGTVDYSGNPITGVPEHVIVTSALVQFPLNLSFFIQHNFTSAISLNDENTVKADAYHLVQAKISRRTTRNRLTIETFFGVDNLLDVRYNLGNDLNAPGGRFYNPAPGRNYFAGIRIAFS